MRVLVVNEYLPPDTSATARVFADVVRALADAGHEARVLCGRPSYDPEERLRWRPLVREASSRVVVERLGSTTFDRRQMWGRALNYLSFVIFAAMRGMLAPRPDVIVAGSDPPFSIWAALAAARGRPVVYSLQDLHPEFAIVSGMIRPGLITKIWERIHSAGLRRAAAIVCLGDQTVRRVQAKGVSPGRIHVIPNGGWAAQGNPAPEVLGELREGAEFLVVHAGNIGAAGAWETLVNASQLLDGSAKILFIGDGMRAERLRSRGATVIPFRPFDQLASVMAAGDLQIVTVRRGMDGLIVPSKIYTILAHGRPLLAVAPEESEVVSIVRRHGCGLVANPDDPAEVASKILWAREHPEQLAQMSKRAKKAFELYRREDQLKKIVSLVEEVAKAHGRRER